MVPPLSPAAGAGQAVAAAPTQPVKPRQRLACRSCGAGPERLGEVIDLGPMPLVNGLLRSADDPCPRWPLAMVFCRDCGLGQLLDAPPPAAMFRDYVYFSSHSRTMVDHAAALVRRFVKPGDSVLEVASNDGYLLRQAQALGARVLGVDPARNIAEHAAAAGVPTRCEFFDAATARAIVAEWGRADVIFANNVLAHVPDPNQLAAGIAIALADGPRRGIAHVETPSLVSLVHAGAFDTIYHEHHSYFCLTALKKLFNRHRLKVIGVESIGIHGGSFHLQVAHEGDESKATALCEQERRMAVLEDRFYAGFARRVDHLKQRLLATVGSFDSVAAYGAAAKGVVLLNRFGLDRARIPFVVDGSPHKQGRFVPGTRQPILPPDELLRRKPAAALILPWNIAPEIMGCASAYANQGGRFIVPIPEVRVIAP